MLNLRADWRNIAGGPIDIGAFLTNATNEDYLVFTNDLFSTFGFTSGVYGEPRMFGVSLRYNFGN